ncbi:MAG: Uma2 family endonuclease [Flaviaesturariibacter sp.]|nr:Uma2 family endonuclease [Flaviaesturariibacter sp.]
MTFPRLKFQTVEEYLAFEDASLEKHEYYQGEIFAMAGASFSHNQIVGNTLVDIGQHLRNKSCQVFPSDLKVQVEANSLFTYPDITILCDKPSFIENRTDAITNPTIIIEVLSPSTMDYDRAGKFILYRALPSLKEYILISSTEHRFEKFVRQGENWLLSEVRSPEEAVSIETIGFQITLSELYRNVDFANNIPEVSSRP